jgi:Alcohol dehydrogenase GroES-like domain
MTASGVCHTDLHAVDADWPTKPHLPFIPGHEGIGIVAKVGSHVRDVKEGDRVGLPWLRAACGQCEWWITGWGCLVPKCSVWRLHSQWQLCRTCTSAGCLRGAYSRPPVGCGRRPDSLCRSDHVEGGRRSARHAFESAFYSALLGERSAEEAAKLLWAAARKGEPWAIQTLLQRLAPQTQSLKLVHERGTDDEFDFRKLTDEQIRQLEAILDNAQSFAIESGEGPTQPVRVCASGVARAGA